MAEARSINDSDCLHRFLFEHMPVRGELVHLDESWQQIAGQADYPPAIRRALGEALAAAVLLASTLKFDGKLTMQLAGDGPMHLLVVQCTSQQEIRGLAKWRGDAPEGDLRNLAGEGRVAITIETGRDQESYQGIVPITGGSLAESLETYFSNSVQLPTRLWLATGPNGAAGMMLQRLPDSWGDEAERAWEHLQVLADTLSRDELRHLADRDILRRLFHQDDLRLFDAEPVRFRCSCSQARVESTLRMLGRDEITDLLREEGRVEVRCEFCNRAYRFDAVDAESLFVDLPADSDPQVLH
ncbi:MAG: Hsp33 family molecular chaperone HslO [Gammaproteobacteria bacterium]|jgi:molecular chaperone Hsp33